MITPNIYNTDPTSTSRKGGALPAIPNFANIEDERKHIKRILVVACRVFAVNGYTDILLFEIPSSLIHIGLILWA